MKLQEFLATHTVTHVPVLLEPVMEFFAATPTAPVVLDGTLGEAGHTRAFLRLRPQATIIALDRDEEMIGRARERLVGDGFSLSDRPEPGHVHIVCAAFSEAERVLNGFGLRADFLLCDLGVSMYHFEGAGRGFSFRDEVLDMRMDPSAGSPASDLVNHLSEQELARIFYELGEERRSREIARLIVKNRPVRSASRLTDLVLQVLIRNRDRSGSGRFIRDQDAARVFQALRIAVNDELGEVRRIVESIPQILAPGGLATIISFHSLEDRIVKNGFRSLPKEEYRVLTKKPVIPDEEESAINPAARSARLRALQRKREVGAG